MEGVVDRIRRVAGVYMGLLPVVALICRLISFQIIAPLFRDFCSSIPLAAEQVLVSVHSCSSTFLPSIPRRPNWNLWFTRPRGWQLQWWNPTMPSSPHMILLRTLIAHSSLTMKLCTISVSATSTSLALDMTISTVLSPRSLALLPPACVSMVP